MHHDTAELLGRCAKHSGCPSCVNDHGCGFFFDTGICVPGGWLKPQANFTDSGAAWSYYHGNCRISTRVEFVVLPSLLILATLVAAVIVMWRRWSFSSDTQSSCASSQASIMHGNIGSGHHHHHHHHHGDERTPLLIDNDPASRPPGVLAMTSSSNNRQAGELGVDIAGNPRQASFEEQYGSWCQRSANKVS